MLIIIGNNTEILSQCLYIPECCPKHPNTHVSVSTHCAVCAFHLTCHECQMSVLICGNISIKFVFLLHWHFYSCSFAVWLFLQGSCQIKNASFLILEVHFYNDLREFLTFKSQLFQPTYCTVQLRLYLGTQYALD